MDAKAEGGAPEESSIATAVAVLEEPQPPVAPEIPLAPEDFEWPPVSGPKSDPLPVYGEPSPEKPHLIEPEPAAPMAGKLTPLPGHCEPRPLSSPNLKLELDIEPPAEHTPALPSIPTAAELVLARGGQAEIPWTLEFKQIPSALPESSMPALEYTIHTRVPTVEIELLAPVLAVETVEPEVEPEVVEPEAVEAQAPECIEAQAAEPHIDEPPAIEAQQPEPTCVALVLASSIPQLPVYEPPVQAKPAAPAQRSNHYLTMPPAPVVEPVLAEQPAAEIAAPVAPDAPVNVVTMPPPPVAPVVEAPVEETVSVAPVDATAEIPAAEEVVEAKPAEVASPASEPQLSLPLAPEAEVAVAPPALPETPVVAAPPAVKEVLPALAGMVNNAKLLRATVRPAPPKSYQPDMSPRITLPGPSLSPGLNSLATAGVKIARTAQNANIVERHNRKQMPWLLTGLVTLLFVSVGIAGVSYFTMGSSDAQPTPPAAETTAPAKAATATPVANPAPEPTTSSPVTLNKQVEVTGFRMVAIANRPPEIHYLVVNHSAVNLSNLSVYVTLRTPDAKAGQPPFSRFSFRAPDLGPYEAKEMVSPIERVPRQLTLPEWQNLKADVEIAR